MTYHLPNDVARCTGIEADGKRICPIRNYCLRYVADWPERAIVHPAPAICTMAISTTKLTDDTHYR